MYSTDIGAVVTNTTVALIGTVNVVYPASPGVMLASEWVLSDYLRGVWVIQPGSQLAFAVQLADQPGEVNISIIWAEFPVTPPLPPPPTIIDP